MADNKAIQTKVPRFYAGFAEAGFPQFLYEADPARPEIIALDKTWSLEDFRALLNPEQLQAFDTVYKNYNGDVDLVAEFASQIDNVNVAKSPLGATLLAMEVATFGAKAKGGASLKEFVEALQTKLAELDKAVEAHNAKIVAETKEPEAPSAPATPAVDVPATEVPATPTPESSVLTVVHTGDAAIDELKADMVRLVQQNKALTESDEHLSTAIEALLKAKASNGSARQSQMESMQAMIDKLTRVGELAATV